MNIDNSHDNQMNVADIQRDMADSEKDMDGKNTNYALDPEESLVLGNVYTTEEMNYEFVLPQNFVGRLIGRHGSFLKKITEQTGAKVIVKRPYADNAWRICSVAGHCPEIEQALEMIRHRFPLDKFSRITMEQINYDDPLPIFASNRKLPLINNYV